MSTLLFWAVIGVGYVGIAYLTYLYLHTRKDTDSNTHRIGNLEVSVKDLCDIIHGDSKKK